jgi:hypothetical protein
VALKARVARELRGMAIGRRSRGGVHGQLLAGVGSFGSWLVGLFVDCWRAPTDRRAPVYPYDHIFACFPSFILSRTNKEMEIPSKRKKRKCTLLIISLIYC